jgi:uncharacterized protein (DUF1330 family)
MDVFQRYSGTLLAVDEAPLVVEGKWDRDKVVVSAGPDEPAFREGAESVDYQCFSGDRHARADTVVLLWQTLPTKG